MLNILLKLTINDFTNLQLLYRAPSFHMPKDISAPLIMVGPGSGIAPFRGFWHHRRSQMKSLEPGAQKPGPIWLFFGCRHDDMELYKEEKENAVSDGVLTESFLALSRDNDCKDVSFFFVISYYNNLLTGKAVKYGLIYTKP